MINSTSFIIFLILPLLVFVISRVTTYRQVFGLLVYKGDKRKAFSRLFLVSFLLLFMPSVLLLELTTIDPTFFIAAIFFLHGLYLSLDCFEANISKSQSINFSILLFLSLVEGNSLQLKYLTLIVCFIIFFNREKKPSELVEFVFVSYEALFLTLVFNKVFIETNLVLSTLINIGFFAILLLSSRFNRRSKFFLNLSKLSCMVFIVYLLYLSVMTQWSYWF